MGIKINIILCKEIIIQQVSIVLLILNLMLLQEKIHSPNNKFLINQMIYQDKNFQKIFQSLKILEKLLIHHKQKNFLQYNFLQSSNAKHVKKKIRKMKVSFKEQQLLSRKKLIISNGQKIKKQAKKWQNLRKIQKLISLNNMLHIYRVNLLKRQKN